MIRILDRYSVKQFLQSLLFGLMAFTLIFLIIDIMENIDDFIDDEVSIEIFFLYYLYFIPDIIRLMTPVATLLATLFSVGKMSTQNELAAIKASGVSLYRFMLPFLVASLIISFGSVYFGGFVVPQANQAKVQLKQTHMKKGKKRTSNDICFQDSENRIVTIRYYDIRKQQANRVSIQEFDPDNPTKLEKRIDSDRMRFDTTEGYWTLYTGTTREFIDKNHVAEENFNSLNIERLNFKPDDVIRKQRKPGEMTLQELQKFAKEQLRAGNNPSRVLIEYHSRIAFAFTCFVVVLLGMPISANRKHGGLAIQFGISFIFTFLYLVFMKISQAFGKNGLMDPMPTAWLSNIIFFVTAVINLIRVRK